MDRIAYFKDFLTVQNGLKLLGTLVASAFSLATLNIYLVRRKYGHIPGPKTKGIVGFYLGNALDVNKIVTQDKKMFADLLVQWHQQYGPVIKIQYANIVIVSTTDADTIKYILVTKNFPKETFFSKMIGFPFGFRFVGHGLLTDKDNNRWKNQRAIFNPGFHRNVLMSLVKHFNSKADLLLERLRTLADGKTVIKLFPEINRAALDIIAMVAFGMNIDTISNKDANFNKDISNCLRIVGLGIQNPLYQANPSNWKEIKELKRIIESLRKMGRDRIMERLDAMSRGEADEHNDILSNILKSAKTDQIDIEVMIDNFVTFFFAGQETTANALAFTFLELGKNKDVFNKCREEVDEVLGSRQDITYEDIAKMKYISCVFKETLRLYPPIPNITRENDEEVIIGGYKIPAHTAISFASYVSGRLEQYYPESSKFKPERFMKNADSAESGSTNYTYFPFSLGPRNCIGQNFAQIEGIAVIAKIVQHFDYELDPNQSMNVIQELTSKPVDGTKVILKLRK